MYDYKIRNRLGLGSILIIVLFVLSIIGLGILYFIDKGRFWDYLPITSIVIIILSLIFAIFNMARRATGGFIFILFFLVFLGGLVASSIMGPFALSRNAQKALDNSDYESAVNNYQEIINNFETSRYYDESLKSITDIYSSISDNENTIKFLKLGIGKDIFNADSLEIKKMLYEAYGKIAEKAFIEKNYNISAINYILSINLMKDVVENFPQSDEAFIVTYKIPEYLFKASQSYLKSGDYNQNIELLKELVQAYPDYEKIDEAEKIIFESSVENVIAMIKNENYKEALDAYQIAQDIAVESGSRSSFDSYNLKVYSSIPHDILLEYAQKLCMQGKNENSLFILEYLLKNSPELAADIYPYYSVCKIRIIRTMDYEVLPEIKLVSNMKNLEGSFILSISSRIEETAYLYLYSSEGYYFELEAKSKIDITLPSGDYEIAVETNNELPAIYYGSFSFEESKKYSQSFTVPEE